MSAELPSPALVRAYDHECTTDMHIVTLEVVGFRALAER